MSVTGSEPISAENLGGIFPVPIALGGTGATTASNAIVTLGIDTFVQQAVENYFDVQNSRWTGSGSATTNANWNSTVTFSLSQASSSGGISQSGNGIYFANSGTYRFTGTLSSTTKINGYGGGPRVISLSSGANIGSFDIDDYSQNIKGSILGSARINGGQTLTIRATPNGTIYTRADRIDLTLSNLVVQRIA